MSASKKRATDSVRISPTQAVREMRDGVPTTELTLIRNELETATTVSQVCADALKATSTDETIAAIALVLERCVCGIVEQQMDRITSLLKGGAA
jgi:hypothetical protein